MWLMNNMRSLRRTENAIEYVDFIIIIVINSKKHELLTHNREKPLKQFQDRKHF